MLGFRKESLKKDENREKDDNKDIAKLFFDAFSERLRTTEHSVETLSTELERINASVEGSRIADLVLLERLQKIEHAIKESLFSVKISLEEAIGLIRQSSSVSVRVETPIQATAVKGPIPGKQVIASQILSPTGELGSLQSITTPTELQVLTLLASEGPKSAPEIGTAVGRSREHTARLMKRLYEEGYVRRDQTRVPFRYSAVEKIRVSANNQEVRGEEKEEIRIPQG